MYLVVEKANSNFDVQDAAAYPLAEKQRAGGGIEIGQIGRCKSTPRERRFRDYLGEDFCVLESLSVAARCGELDGNFRQPD